MQSLLKNLLGPIFYGMGVSEADFDSYLCMSMGYVYAILIALVLMIVVMVLARKAKKGTRGFIRLSSLVAFVAAIAVIANMLCFGPLRSNISTMMNAPDVSLSEATTGQSRETVKKVAEEGFVLLKNNGLLPLSGDVTNLNVFGWASTNPIYGGTGSGSSDSSGNTGILEGLAEAGYTTNADLTQMYRDYKAVRSESAGGAAASINAQSWNLPEPTKEAYTDAVISGAKSFSDTAIMRA